MSNESYGARGDQNWRRTPAVREGVGDDASRARASIPGSIKPGLLSDSACPVMDGAGVLMAARDPGVFPKRLRGWALRGALILGGAALGCAAFGLLGWWRTSHRRAWKGASDPSAPDTGALIVLDANLTVRQATPAVEQVLGYLPEWLIGNGISCYLHPDDSDRVAGELAEDAAVPSLQDGLIEFRMRHVDGSWRRLQASSADPAGRGAESAYHVHWPAGHGVLEEAPRQSLSDPLTGLVSRELFMDRLEHALAYSTRYARYHKIVTILFLGLDNFGSVDHSLDLAAGDQALAIACLRLRQCLRPEDTVPQPKRGEFVVQLGDSVEVGDAVRVAERIIEAFRAPLVVHGQMIYATASVGIATSIAASSEDAFGGNAARPGEELLQAAASAMRRARERRTGYEIFERSTPTADLERLRMESDLRRAVERGELSLCYQPEVMLETGEIVGMEALLRWEYPNRGTVYPEEFVPFIEETGLIVPVGLWTLREACRRSALWRRESGDDRLLMSVNLSARQFQQPRLVEEISGIITETGIDPRNLVLEITESLLLDDTRHVADTMSRIKVLGVKLALDDFGTGYSSLSYLGRFPVDFLKIDKSFVSELGQGNEDTTVLLSALVGVTKTLGIKAIAEGLETAAQVEGLREMHCEMGQGYYFSEPLPGDEAYRLIGTSLPTRTPGGGSDDETRSWGAR